MFKDIDFYLDKELKPAPLLLEEFELLIQINSGKLSKNPDECQIYVAESMPDDTSSEISYVTRKWVLDSIEKQHLLTKSEKGYSLT